VPWIQIRHAISKGESESGGPVTVAMPLAQIANLRFQAMQRTTLFNIWLFHNG
jgi:hypothetical protein